MRFFGRIFRPERRKASDIAFRRAMGVSSDLLRRMREHTGSTEVARAVTSDVWARHLNIPFMTSVYETVQEMKVPRVNGYRPPAKK